MDCFKVENQRESKIINSANKIISLYFSGKKNESIIQSKDFYDAVEYYFNKNINPYGPSYDKSLRAAIIKHFGDAGKVISNEYQIASTRCRYANNNCKMYEFGIDVNARFIYAFTCMLLKSLGYKNDSFLNDPFSKLNKETLLNSNFFPWNGKRQTTNEFYNNFYSSAKRAEHYYKPFEIDGNQIIDMFTSIILSRNAVEQYIKALYDNKFQYIDSKTKKKKTARCGFKDILDRLKSNKLISNVIYTEIQALELRGNLNTHSSYANYAFAAIHNLDVLKYCQEEFNKFI